MTSGLGLCHIGTSKLICETNLRTSSCVMRFLPEGRSETMIVSLGVENILQSCVLA